MCVCVLSWVTWYFCPIFVCLCFSSSFSSSVFKCSWSWLGSGCWCPWWTRLFLIQFKYCWSFCVPFNFNLPWYNCTGWLGIKKTSYLLLIWNCLLLNYYTVLYYTFLYLLYIYFLWSSWRTLKYLNWGSGQKAVNERKNVSKNRHLIEYNWPVYVETVYHPGTGSTTTSE